MEEDLKNIDLIDKYLKENLSASEKYQFEQLVSQNKKFVKELEVYKKIYQGIAEKEKAELKLRLNGYYKKYKLDQKNLPSHNSSGKYRKLYLYGGAVAATLLIGGVFFFLNNSDKIRTESRPSMVDTDATTVKKSDSVVRSDQDKLTSEKPKSEPAANQRDKSVAKTGQNKSNVQNDSTTRSSVDEDQIQLAFGGYKTLPSASVLDYTYSKALSYTFIDNVITLYGDPLMGRLSLLSLKIIKDQGSNYLMNFKGKYYTVEKTARQKPLMVVGERSLNTGFATSLKKLSKLDLTQEKVKIAIGSIYDTSTNLSSLKVRFREDKTIENTYVFKSDGDNLELIINAPIDYEKAKVFRIKEHGTPFYYLVEGDNIFVLKFESQEPKPLIPVDITKNRLARLFKERQSVMTTVYKP